MLHITLIGYAHALDKVTTELYDVVSSFTEAKRVSLPFCSRIECELVTYHILSFDTESPCPPFESDITFFMDDCYGSFHGMEGCHPMDERTRRRVLRVVDMKGEPFSIQSDSHLYLARHALPPETDERVVLDMLGLHKVFVVDPPRSVVEERWLPVLRPLPRLGHRTLYGAKIALHEACLKREKERREAMEHDELLRRIFEGR